MQGQVRIRTGQIEALAELNDTATEREAWKALPFQGSVNLWGDEVYFRIPLSLDLEHGQELVGAGDLGYWPEGNAFCIFFGRTPLSRGGEIRPASAVTVFGRVSGDPAIFRLAIAGAVIHVEKASEE